MLKTLQTIADSLRRTFGLGRDEPAGFKRETGRNPVGNLLRRKRANVALLAILFGVISAAIELPLPAEDFYRALRAEIRARPAPQDVALIAVDDKTLDAFGGKVPSRVVDAQLIDILIGSGVQRVVFDRAHTDPETPAADARFIQTLNRHAGKVWLGMAAKHDLGMQTVPEIMPHPQFRDHVQIAALNGVGTPFRLSIVFPTMVERSGKQYPSASAVLGQYSGPARQYRPDYAFRVGSIPTFSYIDIVKNKIPASALDGKNVIVGESFYLSDDYYHLPFQHGKVAGAYFHILGAHTIKRSTPVELGWFPALAMVIVTIIGQMLTRSKSIRPMALSGLGLLALPLALDEFGINIDIMSAMLALLGAAIGFHRIARKYFNTEVDAMTTTALSTEPANANRDVYALKVAGLAEISEDWTAREIGEFINTLITYVKGPGEVGDVAFERDVLVWLAPRMEAGELERHADGLALMLKTAISHDWQSASSGPALGVDTNHGLVLGQRIKKAMQAAEEAASRGVRFIINDAAYLEARNSRLELLRVLERGLRDRSIGVAYQPKIELATGRIVGAEALIRWRPDGLEFINPQELVLAAEAGDRINELTLVVMETALLAGKQAIALDPQFKLAINMSAKSLSDTHLLFDMMTMLGRFAFPAENLTLELTETAKLEDKQIAPQVAALKARGVCLSIDDFGTGQSNLEYIEKLPSSELKIDKRFVQNMATSEESRAVVRATIEIGHSLGKVVVAEGVEEQAVAAELRAMGCDHAQGYLYSQAIAMPELLSMMGGGRIVVNG